MIGKKLRQLICRCDLFKTTEYLRYNQQPQYRTYTGAVCSIIIVVFFAIVFSNSIVSTLNRQVILWQYGLSQSIVQQLNVTVDSRKNFMFAIGVDDYNLVSGNRYFDFKLEQFIRDQTGIRSQKIQLIPCSRNEWAPLGSNILQIFDRNNFSKRLCPPQGTNFSISGTKSSLNLKYIKMTVQKCSNSSLDTRPCENESFLNDFLTNNTNFQFNLYFINALINPSDPKELSFYLQDRNYVPFNLVYGGQVNMFMSKYQITTDESILPYKENRVSRGGTVNFVGHYMASRILGNTLATINIKKSNLSMYIDRHYSKLDQALSYIGGLFSFILIAFLIMHVYTQFSYEIQMGDRLYHYDKNNPLQSSKFNFLTFIIYIFYSILDFFGCQINWQLMKKYNQCRQEIQKQFDICFLMQRLIFIERSLKILFEDHQFKGLHMHQKLTLKQAQQLRACYEIKQKMANAGTENRIRQDSNQSQSNTNKIHNSDNNKTEDLMMNNNNQIFPLQYDILKQGKHQKIIYQGNNQKIRKKIIGQFQEKKQTSYGNQSENNSELLFQQKQKVAKIEQNNSKFENISSMNTSFHKRLKMLRKQSQQGNLISKKIFNGLNNSEIALGILLTGQGKVQNKGRNSNDIKDNLNQKSQEIDLDQKFHQTESIQEDEAEGNNRQKSQQQQKGYIKTKLVKIEKSKASKRKNKGKEQTNIYDQTKNKSLLQRQQEKRSYSPRFSRSKKAIEQPNQGKEQNQMQFEYIS